MNYRFVVFFCLVVNISAQTQVVVQEVMFMDAPYVGEVTTTTTKYASDGLFRQESSIEVDRFLIRMAMGGNKKLGSVLDGKSESRIVYDANDEEYAMETFNTIRANDGTPTLKTTMGRMNMGGGSSEGRENNNSDEEEEKSEYDRTISESMERVVGFDVRKVTTKIKSNDGLVLIEEWLTTDTTLFHFVSKVEVDLVQSYGGEKRNTPRSFSESMLTSAEQEFESVPGQMVKYTMEMKDEDDDGFKMVWKLKSITEVPYKASDFEIYKSFKKVDELD
ncbi:MAG: hypothetical protein QF842_01210 [Candidatus Marinimicrobia bacterium]|jgi:hypothetical protein|nr:hypothetical protein [Candidatus Neomarinimicrobiota bacterium]MDP6611950.1 hypothetical protein [Candidatus Neomarinimicrobiota bacterium]|tara:strand:- start:23998 stop:24828 length:831 start_codon:yes stop_codon:yes gene_type:complete